MQVYSNPSWREVEADDLSAGIETRVRQTSGGFYNASLRLGYQTEFVNLSKFGDTFTLSGSGINLTMNAWGGSYTVTGGVTGENGKYNPVNARFSRSGASYFYISDFGLNLQFSGAGISGNYDDSGYSRKAVAAVLTLALAAHLDTLPAEKAAKSQQQGEQIWMTYRSSPGAFTQMEANDPFSNLEVTLRKSFNREYDADLEAGAEREHARVSNFFSRTWEYTAGQTRLELEEWAGEYTLKGVLHGYDLPFSGLPVSVKLRPTFGPGQFNASANGLRLAADKNGVRAWLDTKIYPKKLVAVIAALSMAMQQEAAQPDQPW